MDIVDKYYLICNTLDDDIDKVAFAIKAMGAHQRPSFITKDLSYLWLDKYAEQINALSDMIKSSDVSFWIARFASFSKYTGHKYNFDPIRELKFDTTITVKPATVKPDQTTKTKPFDFGDE